MLKTNNKIENRQNKTTIGVLGGIGPESTALFYSKLIKLLQEKGIEENSQYPNIIINSIPAPELIGENSDKIDMYKEGIRLIDSLKPDFIIMVCNTVHVYLPLLKSEVKTQILDVPSIINSKLKNRKLLVLGSSLTAKKRLYSSENFVYPDDSEQKILDAAILDVNSGKNISSQKEEIIKIIKKYNGFEVLAACTEIDLLLEKSKIKYISTLDLMAQIAADKYFEISEKNEK